MNHDIHALINILTNTGILLVCLCSITCFYLRTSILSQRREIGRTNENYILEYNIQNDNNLNDNNLNDENM